MPRLDAGMFGVSNEAWLVMPEAGQPAQDGGQAISARLRALAGRHLSVQRALSVVDGTPVALPQRRECRRARH